MLFQLPFFLHRYFFFLFSLKEPFGLFRDKLKEETHREHLWKISHMRGSEHHAPIPVTGSWPYGPSRASPCPSTPGCFPAVPNSMLGIRNIH